MVRMDIHTGILQWVNAGHPAPLLIRDRRVVQELESHATLPVGFGGDHPRSAPTTCSAVTASCSSPTVSSDEVATAVRLYPKAA